MPHAGPKRLHFGWPARIYNAALPRIAGMGIVDIGGWDVRTSFHRHGERGSMNFLVRLRRTESRTYSYRFCHIVRRLMIIHLSVRVDFGIIIIAKPSDSTDCSSEP